MQPRQGSFRLPDLSSNRTVTWSLDESAEAIRNSLRNFEYISINPPWHRAQLANNPAPRNVLIGSQNQARVSSTTTTFSGLSIDDPRLSSSVHQNASTRQSTSFVSTTAWRISPNNSRQPESPRLILTARRNNQTPSSTHRTAGDKINESSMFNSDTNAFTPTKVGEINGCLICFDDFSPTGEHRLASLKCGHVFGKSCIERWIRLEKKQCPTCQATAVLSDIRLIFGVSVGNADKINQLRAKIQVLQADNVKIGIERAKFEQELQIERARFELEMRVEKDRFERELQVAKQMSAASTSLVSSVRDEAFGLFVKKFSNNISTFFPVDSARSFSLTGNFVVTSCKMSNKNNKHGIQKILLNGSPVEVSPVRCRLICVSVCPFNDNLIASTSNFELTVYESKQGVPFAIRRSYRLNSSGWACAWEDEFTVVIGFRDGTLQKVKLETGMFETLVAKTGVPILSLFFDIGRQTFFVETKKGIYSFKNGTQHLVQSQIEAFHYDSASNCFLIMVPSEDRSSFSLQLFAVNFNESTISSIRIRELSIQSKASAMLFWISPTGHIICSFFDESLRTTCLFSWGKQSDSIETEPKNERMLKVSDSDDAVQDYAYFTWEDRNVFAMLTGSKLYTAIVEYEKTENSIE